MRFLRYFTSRPLHMSKMRNWIAYICFAIVLNNSVNFFWVTKENPEGLTGFPGALLMVFSFYFCFTIAVKENRWVDEIRCRQEKKL